MLKKTLESPLDCKEIQPVHSKGDQSWVFIGRTEAEAETNTLATGCEELTHLKRLWCWERLKVGGEGDNRGWDGWMASPTRWTSMSMDREVWCASIYGIAKSQTPLSNWTELSKALPTRERPSFSHHQSPYQEAYTGLSLSHHRADRSKKQPSLTVAVKHHITER